MIDDDNEIPVSEDRWVRIMCDHAADGLWDRQGRSCPAEELPVNAFLLAMLKGWQEWYEHYDPEEPDPDVFDLKAHSVMGLCIARLVKRALPDWTVIYFDEACSEEALRKERVDGLATPRTEFEFEILLPPAGPAAS